MRYAVRSLTVIKILVLLGFVYAAMIIVSMLVGSPASSVFKPHQLSVSSSYIILPFGTPSTDYDTWGNKTLLLSNSSVYALARPAVDAYWNRSEIFDGFRDFVVLGFSEVQFLVTVLSQFSAVNQLLKATICESHRMRNSLEADASSCWSFTTKDIFVSWLRNEVPNRHNHISHMLVERPSNASSPHFYLFVKLHLISPQSNGIDQYYFSYGLPEELSTTDIRKRNCPPGICSSIFEARTLAKENIAVSLETLLSPKSSETIDNVFEKANRLFKNSRFVACLNLQEKSGPVEPGDLFLDGQLPGFSSSSAWAVRELIRNYGMRVGLDSGTHLGWYRNCSVIGGDADMDLMIPSFDVNTKFYEDTLHVTHNEGKPLIAKLISRRGESEETLQLKSTRIFGDLESGVEVRFGVTSVTNPKAPSVGIDVFILHLDDVELGYPHTDAFVSWQRKIIFYMLPVNMTICSTIFLRDLYLVPCENEDVLAMHYMDTWRTPSGRIDNYWYTQPNINHSVVLTAEQWRKREMYVGYEG